MDFIIRLAEEFFKKHKRLARYRRIFALLAAVVVFATTYELILPAITMDRQRAYRSPGVEVGVAKDQRKGIEFAEDDLAAADTAGEDAFEAGFQEEGDFFEDGAGAAGDSYAEDFAADGNGSADDWMQAENPGAGDTWENADEIVPGADSAGDDYSGSDEAGSLTDADGTGVNASAGDDLAGVPSDSSDPENSGADISVPENAENDNTDESTDLTDGNGTDSEEAGLEGTGSASHEDGQDLETADGEDSEDASDVSSENISGDNTQDASTGASAADSKETDEATDKNSNKSDTASGSTTAGSTTAGSGEAVIEGGTAETAVEFAQDGAAAGATDLAALDATGEAAAAITYPATIIYEGKDYTVTATFDEKAKLPAEVTLSAVEILPNKVYKDENGNPLYADYEEYYQKTLEALEKEKRLDDDQTVKSARFFDITFLDKEGKTVEPAAPVSIAVKYKDALSAVDTADTMAVHFEDNKAGNSADANEDGSEDNTEVIDDKDSGNNNENKAKAPADITVPEILDTKTEVKKKTIQEISFEAEKFSVYGVIGTELMTEVVLPGDNDTYVVTVTAPAEAGIPSGSALKVVPFDEGSKEYDYARYSVLADKKEKGEQVDLDNFNLAAMDISIIGPDGNEIEPKAAVSVNIKIKNLPGVEDLDEIEDTIEIQHHVEAEGGVVIEKVFDGKAEGTYEMNTKEKIVSEGTVVDPGAVNEDDFREEQDASSFNLDAPAEDQADSEEEGIDINFGTSTFSTFTVTWSSASNTTTNLRWRNGSGYNATTYGQVTLHYVDQNGTPITRPGTITADNINDTNHTGGNIDYSYDIEDDFGKTISGYTYQGAHYNSANGADVTSIQLYRLGNNGTRYIRLNNGNGQVFELTADGDWWNTPTTHVYLVYSGSTTSNSVTVHYVDESGNDLPIANSASTYTDLDSNSSSPAYLIYDINGYDYSYCYKKTDNTDTNIRPRLQKSNNVWQYAAESSDTWTNLSNGDEIFVVYKKKPTPAAGGSPQVGQNETWPDQDDPPGKPTFSKSSLNHGDATNLIKLSITAPEKPVIQATPADVIVVFDNSYSMEFYDMAGNNSYSGNVGTRRLAVAKTAVNKMANTLLTDQNAGVRMALITFGTDAEVLQTFTDNYMTFSGKVNDITAPSSARTNWEKGLRLANEMVVRDNAATFVVFVTDGDPTVRMSRGDYTNSDLDELGMENSYYNDDFIFGDGNLNEDNYNACYIPAVPEVKSIVDNNKNFYAIGVSNDVSRLKKLMRDTEQNEDNAFICTNEQAMTDAFESITEAIKSTLGFGNIHITDGITELTNAEMKVMQTVDPESFQYYRYGGEGNKYGADEAHMTEWTTRETDKCGAASYNTTTGAVEWNMGEGFQLEDRVTYVVTFRVWPSQEAYDLVADMNNKIKSVSTISQEEMLQLVVKVNGTTYTYVKDQGWTSNGGSTFISKEDLQALIDVPSADVVYLLKTNTDQVNATYNRTTKTGEVVTVSDTADIEATYDEGTLEDMTLESMLLTIKKEFEDGLTDASDRETVVKLIIKRRVANETPPGEFQPYAVPQAGGVMSSEITLNEDNNWTYSLYVAPGLKVDNKVLEYGYDFTLAEPGVDYHYELVEEIINPMIVDGEDKYYGDGYLIDDDVTLQQYVDRSLTGINRVKSGIDVQKLVYDVDGTTMIYPDTEFTITGSLLGPDGQPFIYPPPEGTTVNNGSIEDYSGAYDIFVPDPDSQYSYPEHPYVIDGVTYTTYNRTAHKLHFDDSSDISFTLKAGEWIRFINVPQGCTFEFTESTTDMDASGYEWKNTSATVYKKAGNDYVVDTSVTPPSVSDKTASLDTDSKGVVGNRHYSVKYENKRTVPLPEFELVKVDAEDNTQHLNDAEFKLYTDEDRQNEVTSDGNGNAIAIKTGNKENSAGSDGWYLIGVLPAGTYYLYETKEPALHQLNDKPVIINVGKNGNAYTVTATQDGQSVLTKDGNRYTITVKNERGTKWVRFKKVDLNENPLGGANFDFVKGANTIQLTSYDPDTVIDEKDVSGLLKTSEGTYTFEMLMSDNAYTLSETNPPAGFLKLANVVDVTVSTTGVSASLRGTVTRYKVEPAKGAGTEGAGTEENPYVVFITNSAGEKLPNTGGSGKSIYTLGGIFIMMTAALMYVFRMRRRERRLR